MKKSVASAVLCVVLAFQLAACGKGEADVENEKYNNVPLLPESCYVFEEDEDNNGYCLTNVFSLAGEFDKNAGYVADIPSEHKGKPVTSIKVENRGEVYLLCVKIPASVVDIAMGAFAADFHGLEHINVSDQNKVYTGNGKNITEKETKTLVSSLEGTIPSDGSVKRIPLYVFSPDVTELYIPDCVEEISADAPSLFKNTLKTISVSENNKHYHSENNCLIHTETNTLVMGCASSVVPSYVTAIGKGAFALCDTLESIELPTGVVCIGDASFGYNSALKSIKIPSSTSSIGCMAFIFCESIEEVVIPASVTSIDVGAFNYCISLKSVTFEDCNGWQADGKDFDVSDPQKNAEILKEHSAPKLTKA